MIGDGVTDAEISPRLTVAWDGCVFPNNPMTTGDWSFEESDPSNKVTSLVEKVGQRLIFLYVEFKFDSSGT